MPDPTEIAALSRVGAYLLLAKCTLHDAPTFQLMKATAMRTQGRVR